MNLADPVTQPEFYESVTIKRGIAWVIDIVLIGILVGLVVPFTAFTGIFFLPFLFAVLSFLYRWITIASGSATLGMRLMAIEFRKGDGTRFDSSTALLHTLGYFVSNAIAPLQLVSIVLMFVSARGQGLTDHVLDTAVLNTRAS